MKNFPLALALGLLSLGPIVHAQTSTVSEPLNQDVLRRHQNFGYTADELKKWFSEPRVFEFDVTGMAKDRLKTPPAPGVHPRVFFNPEEVPALRKKLSESVPGKLKMDAIRKAVADLITGPKAKYAGLYNDAIKGVPSKDLLGVEPACAIEYEAFRALIDNDAEGAKKAAAALTSLARVANAALDEDFAKEDASKPDSSLAPGAKRLRDYQRTKTITQAGMLGLAYDFIYNWMTPEQRDVVRATIAKASAGMTLIGAEGLPAFPFGTSNWVPMHLRLILLTLSIEGEKGYDPTTLERCVKAYKNYLGAGFFPAGEMYESMGKNFICTENLMPLANRGINLIALKKIRSQINNYYLNAMDPWGGHFTFYDSLGGRGNNTPMFDVLIVKHLFPNDPAVDFVYRNTVGDDYAAFKGQVRFGHPFHLNNGIVQAVFAEDYDASKTWDQAQAAATAGKPLTYFSDDTGNLITRSAWTKDALQLHFLTRCVAGGHVYADRTHFSIHALGRYWAIYKPLRQLEEHYSPRNRSVILIDGNGPGMATSRCVDLQDNLEATFIVADAKTAYDWTTGGNNRFPKNGQPAPFTGNDFRLHKSPLAWMNAPWSELPFWQTSQKGSELWIPFHPVQRAFRTAGLVRGKHPYVLIADDFQKDAAAHDYEWGMILEDDLEPQSAAKGALPGDLTVAAPTDAEGRAMLVRVLNVNGQDPKTAPVVERFDLPNPPQKPIPMNRLVVKANAVAPDFRVLLFPHRQGEESPKTSWNADRTVLTVAWSDQVDTITFAKAGDGRTRIRVSRDGIVAVQLK